MLICCYCSAEAHSQLAPKLPSDYGVFAAPAAAPTSISHSTNTYVQPAANTYSQNYHPSAAYVPVTSNAGHSSSFQTVHTLPSHSASILSGPSNSASFHSIPTYTSSVYTVPTHSAPTHAVATAHFAPTHHVYAAAPRKTFVASSAASYAPIAPVSLPVAPIAQPNFSFSTNVDHSAPIAENTFESESPIAPTSSSISAPVSAFAAPVVPVVSAAPIAPLTTFQAKPKRFRSPASLKQKKQIH